MSQTLQLGSLNFPRISPTIDTEKMKLQEAYSPDKVLAELDADLSEDRRLSLCNVSFLESTRSLIEKRVRNYVKIISLKIDHRFPPESLTMILKVFSIF